MTCGSRWIDLSSLPQDTLRECPPDPGVDFSCNPSLQFISPMYFVSFVLTAQFVLINVVVAVLMKHLDDSNKEAKEEAEMDAEIEMELAQGTLCCMGGLGGPGGVGIGCTGVEKGGGEGGEKGVVGCSGMSIRHVATTHPGPNEHPDPGNRKLYSPAQVRWTCRAGWVGWLAG